MQYILEKREQEEAEGCHESLFFPGPHGFHESNANIMSMLMKLVCDEGHDGRDYNLAQIRDDLSHFLCNYDHFINSSNVDVA